MLGNFFKKSFVDLVEITKKIDLQTCIFSTFLSTDGFSFTALLFSSNKIHIIRADLNFNHFLVQTGEDCISRETKQLKGILAHTIKLYIGDTLN